MFQHNFRHNKGLGACRNEQYWLDLHSPAMRRKLRREQLRFHQIKTQMQLRDFDLLRMLQLTYYGLVLGLICDLSLALAMEAVTTRCKGLPWLLS